MTIWRKRDEAVGQIAFPSMGAFMSFLTKITVADMISGDQLMYDVTNSQNSIVPATGLAVNDVIECFQIPAGTVIFGAGVSVVTASTEASDYILGDGNDDNGYVESTGTDAVAATWTAVGYGYGADAKCGVLYSAADTIDLLVEDTALMTGVMDVYAVGFRLY